MVAKEKTFSLEVPPEYHDRLPILIKEVAFAAIASICTIISSRTLITIKKCIVSEPSASGFIFLLLSTDVTMVANARQLFT
jgi:hypothetical protein